MNDNELFELCKSVYEATGWSNTTQYLWVDDSFHSTHPEWDSIEMASHNMSGKGIPLYTSDYLLSRLPNDERCRTDLVRLQGKWEAYYWQPPPLETLGARTLVIASRGWSDTPLKALLKLTLELHKKGLLDVKDN